MDPSKARRHPLLRNLLILPLISQSFRANQDAEGPDVAAHTLRATLGPQRPIAHT